MNTGRNKNIHVKPLFYTPPVVKVRSPIAIGLIGERLTDSYNQSFA